MFNRFVEVTIVGNGIGPKYMGCPPRKLTVNADKIVAVRPFTKTNADGATEECSAVYMTLDLSPYFLVQESYADVMKLLQG